MRKIVSRIFSVPEDCQVRWQGESGGGGGLQLLISLNRCTMQAAVPVPLLLLPWYLVIGDHTPFHGCIVCPHPLTHAYKHHPWILTDKYTFVLIIHHLSTPRKFNLCRPFEHH